MAAGHRVARSHPKELADILEGYATGLRARLRLADHYDAELRRHHERLREALVVGPADRVLDIGCGTAIRHALTAGGVPAAATGPDPFSLADPAAVQSILAAAGFVDVGITDVREPVYYGPDAAAAFDLVRDMKMTRELVARLDAVAAQRALARLREMLAAHETSGGVLFDSRAWIVTARRAAT